MKYLIDFLKKIFTKIGYEVHGERPIFIVKNSKTKKIIEFIGPSGSGKTTAISNLHKINIIKYIPKKVVPNQIKYKFDVSEIQAFINLFQFSLDEGNISPKKFNSIFRKFLLNRFLVDNRECVILDEGLFKLRLIDIVNMKRENIRIILQGHIFVIFKIDEEVLIERLKFNNKIINIDSEYSFRDHIKEYDKSIQKFITILNSEGIPYKIIEFESNQLTIAKKISDFLSIQLDIT